MGERRLLVADGGNSKTDLALLGEDGRVLGAARGPGSNPDIIGVDGCLAVLGELVERATHAAGLDGAAQVADLGAFYLAGVDLPVEERHLTTAMQTRHWSAQTVVANDIFAVLRAGTARSWGVATVCGAGINCAGVGMDAAPGPPSSASSPPTLVSPGQAPLSRRSTSTASPSAT